MIRRFMIKYQRIKRVKNIKIIKQPIKRDQNMHMWASHMMAITDKRSNNDWDELARKGTLSGLQKMDAIEHPKFDLNKMIKEIKRSRVQIWNEKIQKTFDDVEQNFSIQNKRIIKLLKAHDWRKNSQIPNQIRLLMNGSNAIVEPPKKKRKLAA
eukprot:482519_1